MARGHSRGGEEAETPPYGIDADGRPVDIGRRRRSAHPLQTPHSGRHFEPSRPPSPSEIRRPPTPPGRAMWCFAPLRRFRRRDRRFTEGWYYRLTLPDEGESFVFIFSVEDPGHEPRSDLALACMQVMGPGDEYLVQAGRDAVDRFWAWRGSQGLGCAFEWEVDGSGVGAESDGDTGESLAAALVPEEWRRRVRSGFQVLPNSLQGKLVGHDGTMGGVLEGQGVPGTCDFDLTIDPVAGWGNYGNGNEDVVPGPDQRRRQLSTAGWLASLPVFEPHWQITMAHARASGTVTWKGRKYEVKNAPFYAEKNWGGAFPPKWYWVQCNSFVGYPDLSVTAGGGIRELPLLGGRTESLGLLGVHYGGRFYEAVPWTGDVGWRVEPWGRWELRGRCIEGDRTFEVELTATCDGHPGLPLRAPTKDRGMQYFARDTFYADMTLTLWELQRDEGKKRLVRVEPPLIDGAFSPQGGVEVGGGPWQ